MNYNEIIRKAWSMVRQHRSLWWLGLLAMLTEPGNYLQLPNLRNNVTVPSSSPSPSPEPTIAPVAPGLESDAPMDELASRVLGATSPDQMQQVLNWLNDHLWVVALIILAAIALKILLDFISLSAKAGLINSVDKADKKQTIPTFKQAFSQGRGFFWRLFSLYLLTILATLLAILLLIGLAIALVVTSAIAESTILTIGAIIIGLLFLLAFTVFTLYLSVLRLLADREIVLHNQSIWQAIKKTNRLIRNQLTQAGIALLVSIGLSLVFMFVVGVALALILLAVGALGYAIYNFAPTTLFALYAGIMFAILAALVFWVSGGYNAFQSAYWTLAYKALRQDS